MPTILFATRGLEGAARGGATLHEAVLALGHVIDLACGGQAQCASCCVLVSQGEDRLEAAGLAERAQLERCGLAPPWRLSCQARLLPGPGEVTFVAC